MQAILPAIPLELMLQGEAKMEEQKYHSISSHMFLILCFLFLNVIVCIFYMKYEYMGFWLHAPTLEHNPHERCRPTVSPGRKSHWNERVLLLVRTWWGSGWRLSILIYSVAIKTKHNPAKVKHTGTPLLSWKASPTLFNRAYFQITVQSMKPKTQRSNWPFFLRNADLKVQKQGFWTITAGFCAAYGPFYMAYGASVQDLTECWEVQVAPTKRKMGTSSWKPSCQVFLVFCSCPFWTC